MLFKKNYNDEILKRAKKRKYKRYMKKAEITDISTN